MKRLLRGAGSLVFWAFLFFSSLAAFPIAVLIWALASPFDARRRLLHIYTCFWASLYTWLNPVWPVFVDGRDKIRRGVTYVMVANHQSLVDILVLFRLFVHFKWVSKIENFRVPVVGWNMSMNRYIKLVRGNRESVATMMDECRDTLAAGNSIMMFPEGTRSLDGHMRAFKPGAFQLAKDNACPILPIVLDGSARALPKRGFVLKGYHPIHVRVLNEIPAEAVQKCSVEEMTDRVRSIIAAELSEDPVSERLSA